MPRAARATPERILDAALVRFAQYGFRRTSMEDIAAEAGVSRAALYLQFDNKEAIFRALSEALHERALAAAIAALAGGEALEDRLRTAVEALSLRFVELVYGSPHGGELLDERNRLCGDLAADMDRRFRDALARAFERAGRAGAVDLTAAGLRAAAAAEVFARAAAGLKGPGVGVDVYRRRLADLTRVFVAGLGGRRRPRAARRA